jgi:hypothetical protein
VSPTSFASRRVVQRLLPAGGGDIASDHARLEPHGIFVSGKSGIVQLDDAGVAELVEAADLT